MRFLIEQYRNGNRVGFHFHSAADEEEIVDKIKRTGKMPDNSPIATNDTLFISTISDPVEYNYGVVRTLIERPRVRA